MIRKYRLSPASFAALAFAFLFAASCASMQKDLLVSSVDDESNAQLSSLESMIVPLDSGASRDQLASARSLVAELEAKPVKDTVFEARLMAWSGRLFLLEGKRAEAEKRLRRSVSLLAGDVPVQVLEARLEGDAEKRVALIDGYLASAETTGILGIERARACIELRRYREAVAAFDSSFILLPPFYESTYRAERDRAWELRDLDPTASTIAARIANAPRITWLDAIELAKSETDLLSFMTADKNRPSSKLFPSLVSTSFILAGTRPEDTVSRAGAAWFLWHLLARERSDPSLLDKYSQRMKSRPGAASPVPDVPVSAPTFDSAIGCVEWEIMSLPDGSRFFPDDPVQGSAFLGMLKKVD